MEFCDATLDGFVKGTYRGSMPSDIIGLLQMAEGLNYLHSKKIVHQNIHPGNILISASSSNVQLKISELPLTEIPNVSKVARHYTPPEVLQQQNSSADQKKITKKPKSSDVFSMGCVFYFFVTRGQHLFGSSPDITDNIIKGEFQMIGMKMPWRIFWIF
jgi:serine/threonine protein kinase